MMYWSKTGCQIVRKNRDEEHSFVINYFFEDNEKHPVQKLFLTPNGRFLCIVRKNKVVTFKLSTKPYSDMVLKKSKKGLEVQWGIVKESKVHSYSSNVKGIWSGKIGSLNNIPIRGTFIYEENGTKSILIL